MMLQNNTVLLVAVIGRFSLCVYLTGRLRNCLSLSQNESKEGHDSCDNEIWFERAVY